MRRHEGWQACALLAVACLVFLGPWQAEATLDKLENLPSISSFLPSIDKSTVARFLLRATLWKLQRKLFSGSQRGGPEFHYHHHAHKHYHHYHNGAPTSSTQAPVPVATSDSATTTTTPEEPVLGWAGLLVPTHWGDS
ncbi:nuclear receptor subfamily 4 group A member 3-like [Bacillus rossius redtenbacheri]|uniref:nuclear receptor subfamily 4 group A member 3-like n=1 Tax=Bacillus rossius redtenbacheri TaxID=93214 RepID=UPI002FDCBAD5